MQNKLFTSDHICLKNHTRQNAVISMTSIIVYKWFMLWRLESCRGMKCNRSFCLLCSRHVMSSIGNKLDKVWRNKKKIATTNSVKRKHSKWFHTSIFQRCWRTLNLLWLFWCDTCWSNARSLSSHESEVCTRSLRSQEGGL